MSTLVWFRNDLRTLDNRALQAAAIQGAPVRALYVATPRQWREHAMAPRRVDLLRRAVRALGERLAGLGIALDVLAAPRFADIPGLLRAYCREHRIASLHANREYLVNELARDRAVSEALPLPCHFHCDHLLLEPGTLLTAAGEPYRVFTPFARAARRRLREAPPRCLARPRARPEAAPFDAATLPDFGETADSNTWPADEEGALKALRRFCRQRGAHYRERRDRPALEGTSRLSPLLAIGLLSPRQCLARLEAEHGDRWLDTHSGPGSWFNELLWREFYQHVAWHFPRVVKGRAFKPETDRIRWREDDAAFAAWCEGRTGYPIVDAGMRQLKQTGWMHNRLRMITASFLVKDLHIDWRRGERFFMENLIDGDFAANNGGWQWAASTGTDAAPYFRIFNPTSQSRRFDPNGDFLRHHLPELAHLDNDAIHQPPATEGYPAPIVDHRAARQITLSLFGKLTGQ